MTRQIPVFLIQKLTIPWNKRKYARIKLSLKEKYLLTSPSGAAMNGLSKETTMKEGKRQMEIRHSITGETLFKDDSETMQETLEAAVKAGANLEGADLRGANLRDA